MTLQCREVRELLTREAAAPDPAVVAHLRACPACDEYAVRADRVRRLLARPKSEHRPDPGFAARVTARLPDRRDALGWAALRVLPATSALVLALLWICLRQTPAPADLLSSDPDEALVTWLLETPGEGEEG